MPSPECSGNPFGVLVLAISQNQNPQKIAADSGNMLLKAAAIQFLRL